MNLVTHFTLVKFFSDDANLVLRGENSFKSNKVLSCSVKCIINGSSNKPKDSTYCLEGQVEASMKKRIYNVKLSLCNGEVLTAACECPKGNHKCHHMASLLVFSERHYSPTSLPCHWNRPKASTSKDESVQELWPQKEKSLLKSDINDAKRNKFLESLNTLNRFSGFQWILRPEPEEEVHFKTMDQILAKEEFRDAKDKGLFILENMSLTPNDVQLVETLTRGQRNSSLWYMYRKFRLTASHFGNVLKSANANRCPPSLVKTIFSEYFGENAKSLQWGVTHEEVALQRFSHVTDFRITKCGLVLQPNGILGASPDGLVHEDSTVEVKCPYKWRFSTIQEAIADKDFFLENIDGLVSLKKTSPYYHQVQGTLHITEKENCFFIVWTCKDFFFTVIQKDAQWIGNLEVLKNFYKKFIVNEILLRI